MTTGPATITANIVPATDGQPAPSQRVVPSLQPAPPDAVPRAGSWWSSPAPGPDQLSLLPHKSLGPLAGEACPAAIVNSGLVIEETAGGGPSNLPFVRAPENSPGPARLGGPRRRHLGPG